MNNSPRGGLPGCVPLAICLLGLSGCAALPPMIEQGYAVISGISYLATSKGPADHAISMATRKDCSLFRLLRLRPVCVPVTEDTNRWLLATLTDLLDMEPRHLPPEALLAELPPPVDPRLSALRYDPVLRERADPPGTVIPKVPFALSIAGRP